jgi:hypothetical protein
MQSASGERTILTKYQRKWYGFASERLIAESSAHEGLAVVGRIGIKLYEE